MTAKGKKLTYGLQEPQALKPSLANSEVPRHQKGNSTV